jgi:CheY-like chemotaxis protein
VDDHSVNLAILKKMVTKFGVDCDTAISGQQALDRAHTLPYGLILMDCQMPVMDGFEASAGIRNDRQSPNQHTTIIALSATPLTADIAAQMKAVGMNAYQTKPISLEQLRLLIDTYLAPVVSPASTVLSTTTAVVGDQKE